MRRAPLGVDAVRRMVAQDACARPNLRWVGCVETDATMAVLAADLLAETEPERVLPYVQLFQQRPFPLEPARLLDLASAEGRPPLRRAARRALAQLRRPEVRTLALAIIAESAEPDEGVGMLARNYEPGDHRRIEPLWEAERDADGYHALSLAVCRCFEANPVSELTGSLLGVYEKGPCGFCRHDAVESLLRLNALPIALLEECRFDSEASTRRLVAAVPSA